MSHTGTSHGPLSRPVQWVVFEVSCDPVLTQTRSLTDPSLKYRWDQVHLRQVLDDSPFHLRVRMLKVAVQCIKTLDTTCLGLPKYLPIRLE